MNCEWLKIAIAVWLFGSVSLVPIFALTLFRESSKRSEEARRALESHVRVYGAQAMVKAGASGLVPKFEAECDEQFGSDR